MVTWTQPVTNVDLLDGMGKGKEICNGSKRQKLEYFGHVMINTERYELLQVG